MAGGTPWWSWDRELKDAVNEDGKSADDRDGEADEGEEADDMVGVTGGIAVGGKNRRLERRLQAPE